MLLTVRWDSTGTVSMIEPLSKLARLDVLEADSGHRGFIQYQPRPSNAVQRRAATAGWEPNPVSPYPEEAEAIPDGGAVAAQAEAA